MYLLNVVCDTKHEDKWLVSDNRQDVLSYRIQMKLS